MSMECNVCRDSYRKLKQLQCRHSFCPSCLEKIERHGRIKCPYCRQETALSAFGIGDLISQFTGRIECTDCSCNVELHESLWCPECVAILCASCVKIGHKSHNDVQQVHKTLAPVKYCVQQLDKFSAVHTKLTLLQKQLIIEYMRQLSEALQRELDDDLTTRINRLKAEKQYLRQVFDIDVSSEVARESSHSSLNQNNDEPSSSVDTVITETFLNQCKLADGAHFASILKEVYKLSPASLQCRANLGSLPKDGVIFNPLPLEKMVDLFLEMGRFSTFSVSMNTMKRRRTHQTPVNYLGAGILDDPCDLCVIPERKIVLVTCVNRGMYSFLINDSTSDSTFRHYPTIEENDQFAGIAYDSDNRYIITTVLRDYTQWIVQIYERRGMRLRAEIPCPTEPRIHNSWYRWIISLPRGHALISTGDQHTSVLWLLNLHSKRWTTLHTRENATFRKVAFHQPTIASKQEGLLYVPDMRNKTIVTFLLNTKTWELSKENEIKTAEFLLELPICVNAKGGKLIVGYWNTGNIIYADLSKSSSITLTSVGPKQLFSFCFVDMDSILILCKQRELIEAYTLA